jgi:hypothetical protein
VNSTHVAGPLYLEWGPGVSWYNFKFDNTDTRILKTDDGLEFKVADPDVNSIKSKLVASYVNMSLVPMPDFGRRTHSGKFSFMDKNSRGFRFGIGGYGGYRIGSRTKFVVKDDGGDKEREKDKKNFYLNNWRYGEFSNGSIQTLGTSAVVSLASGDIDGDSVSDLAVGTIAGRPIEIYLGSGNRTFLTGPVLVPENARNSAIALADITGDGAADLVVANGAGAVDVVYANNGSGQFSLLTSLDSTFANDVALADINMDGDLDIIVATEQANPVYLGNGSGGFALLTSLGAANTQGVEVADVNADNRPDLIFANVGAASEVWLNVNGNGFEQPKSATAGVQKMSAQLPLGDTAGVVAADFDNSGSIDLAFARIPSSTDDIPANPVLLNDGAGNFTLSAQLGSSATTDIHAGDIDEDGFVDLLFVNSNGVHQVWRGGVAGFSLYSEQIVGNGALVGLLAELGNDGGLDLALGGVQQPGVDLYLNDSFGNLGHGDAVPPSIQLLGETAMEVASGSSFNDPGATASDNIDGDISNRVVASSNVNTAIVGTYQVTYNVTDLAGNSAPAVSRQVTVTPAAGTGGGGGGVVLPYALMLLVLVLAIRLAGKRNRIIHSTVIQQ